METSILVGTKEQFEFLYKDISILDKDSNKIPEEVEMKICGIDLIKFADKEHHTTMTDDEFIELALKEGEVYSIDKFTKLFNVGYISSINTVIRFINVKK